MCPILNRECLFFFSFAGYLGVYGGTKCSMIVARGKRDVWNAGAAGAVAGSLSVLRTRNPTAIAASAFVGGGIMMVLEGLGGH